MLTQRATASNRLINSRDRDVGGTPQIRSSFSLLSSRRTTKQRRVVVVKIFLGLAMCCLTISVLGRFNRLLLQEQPTTNLKLANLLQLVRAEETHASTSSTNGTASVLSTNKDDFYDYSQWLGCLTDDCIQKIAARIARAYPPRHNKSSWCHDDSHNNNRTPKSSFSGLMLTKVPKCASSTSAGVTLRIAHRHDCRAVHWQHRLGRAYNNNNNNNNNNGYDAARSFVWTTVRDPARRAVSTLFYHVVSRSRNPTAARADDVVLAQLENSTDSHYGTVAPETAGFQLRYTLLQDENVTKGRLVSSSSERDLAAATKPMAWNPQEPEQVQDPAFVVALVQSVIQNYDFILVPERMDESLVALALTLQIDVGDVLVASSKMSSSAQYTLVGGRCIAVVPSVVSPAVQTYFESDAWRALNYGDYLLHAAAQISLDRTIQQYNNHNNNNNNGTTTTTLFAEALQRYRALRTLERERCPPPNFPCSADGKPQIEVAARNCYLKSFDFGCGYPCVDALLLELEQQTNATIQ